MLEKLKLLLGLERADTSMDGQLNLLLSFAAARLQALLGGIEPPESMEYIIVEVAVRRFNRIGSEGLSGHTVEGESLQFADSDFAGFSDEIQAFLETQKSGNRGKLRFL